jgi:hypothetical protein
LVQFLAAQGYMAIDIQQIINNSSGISLFSAIARLIPVRLGYRLADFTDDWIAAQHDSRMVRAVRANQRVTRGKNRWSRRVSGCMRC